MASKKSIPTASPKRGRGRPPKFPGGAVQITVRVAEDVADALVRFASYQRGIMGRPCSPGDVVTLALSTCPPFLAFLKQAGLFRAVSGAFSK